MRMDALQHITMPGELWKPLDRCIDEELANQYLISNMGRVYSIGRRICLSCRYEKRMMRVRFKGWEQISLARAVLTIFDRPASQLEIAAYWDGDTTNCKLTNLYWERRGLMVARAMRKVSKLSEYDIVTIRKRYAQGERSIDLAVEYDISQVHVSRIASGSIYKDLGGPITQMDFKHNHSWKLDEKKVIEIRLLAEQGETFEDLATTYGVTAQTIKRVAERDSWKWVE